MTKKNIGENFLFEIINISLPIIYFLIIHCFMEKYFLEKAFIEVNDKIYSGVKLAVKMQLVNYILYWEKK